MEVQQQTSLEKVFNFTPDDLRENRQGRLSAAQLVHLRRIAQRMAFTILGILGVLAVLTIVTTASIVNDLPIFFLVLITTAAIILGVTVGATEVAIGPKVVAIRSGTAHMAYGMFSYSPPLDPSNPFARHTVGAAGTYRMLVGETRFNLTREQWNAIPPGAQITIYWLPTIKKILAVEILSTDVKTAEPPPIDIIAETLPRIYSDDEGGDMLKG